MFSSGDLEDSLQLKPLLERCLISWALFIAMAALCWEPGKILGMLSSLWQNTFQSILSNVLGSLGLPGPYTFICCLQVKL